MPNRRVHTAVPKSNTGRLVTALAVTAKTVRENNHHHKTKQPETNKQKNNPDVQ